jgi:hypothetical protein
MDRCSVGRHAERLRLHMASGRDLFVGRWMIVSMDVWDELDLMGPAFIEFDSSSTGARCNFSPSRVTSTIGCRRDVTSR